jgi:hypothetical protein
MRRMMFFFSYALLNLAPFYGLAGGSLAACHVLQSPFWVLPVFVLFVPAGLYLLSRRCPSCRQLIYTTDTLKRAGKLQRIPVRIFQSCPNCGHALPASLGAHHGR